MKLKFIVSLSVVLAFGNKNYAQPIIAENHFDVDREGWTAMRTNGQVWSAVPMANLSWISSGGNPGGYFQHVDPNDSQTSYWTAPSTYLGNRSTAYGGTLSFDLKQSPTGLLDRLDLIMQGSNMTIVLNTSYNPRSIWTRYHVLLTENGGWHVTTSNGPTPTQAEMQQVLSSIVALRIRAEYRSGDETDAIDNVILRGPSSECPSSTFDTDGEGWWTLLDSNTPTWTNSSGNPGGCFEATDLGQNTGWRFLAPAKFLGDRSAFVGSVLEFDLKGTPAGAGTGPNIVVVKGANKILAYTAGYNPTSGTWTHYGVPLFPTSRWIRTSDGQTPTEQDFEDILGSLTELNILGEYFVSNQTFDTGSLDNVFFLACRSCAAGGDLDLNGEVDVADIPIMIDLLLAMQIDPAHIACADLNGDGFINGADIALFSAAIIN